MAHANKPSVAERSTAKSRGLRTLERLYETDETAWLERMSRLVKNRRLAELDCDNLAEYLESMARRDRREVDSRLRVLIAHLLKWQFQPENRSKSWRITILNQRTELESLLSGVLLRHAGENLQGTYAAARKMAAYQTGLPLDAFPNECPYTLDQVLTEEIL